MVDLNPPGLTLAAARRLYSRPPSQNTLGVFGDSITNNGLAMSATFANKQLLGYWVPALAFMGQRLQLINQGGKFGETTTQMVTRLDAYLAQPAYWNWVLAGINDILNDTTPYNISSTVIANLTTIYDRIEAAGGRVVAVTICPNTSGSGTAARWKQIHQVNDWIRRQRFTRPGFVVADPFAATAQANGTWLGGMADDGLHPKANATFIMGKCVADAMLPYLPATNDSLPLPGDPANLVTNPGAVGTGGTLGTGVTGTASTGWTASNIGTTSAVSSLVQRTDGIAGYWHHVVITSGGVMLSCASSVGSGQPLAVGDKVYAVAEVKAGSDLVSQGTTGEYFRLKCSARNTGYSDLFTVMDFDNPGKTMPTAGLMPTERLVLATLPFTIPAGTNRDVAAGIQCNYPGSFDVGRLGIYKVGTGPLYDTDYALYNVAA